MGGAVTGSGGAPGVGGQGTGPCFNGVQDQDETDVDCGGVCGPSCASGQTCSIPNDCFYGICTNDVCVDPTCDDGLLNQGETAIDCGGPCGATCEVGQRCVAHTDCVSGACDLANYECIPADCTDGVYNQDESDIDCGGVCGPTCTWGKVCNSNTDCVSNDCVDNVCQSEACADPGLGIVASYTDNSLVPSSNTIGLRFSILNNGASVLDLTTVEVRYYFTAEGSGTMVAECDYAAPGCTSVATSFSNVNPVASGADTYASVTFSSGTIPAGSESGRVELRLHTSGYTELDQSNDWSFVEGAAGLDNPNITVYADGIMVWGCLPEPI
jgi:hypothetical protein